jgi:hypothetical protein
VLQGDPTEALLLFQALPDFVVEKLPNQYKEFAGFRNRAWGVSGIGSVIAFGIAQSASGGGGKLGGMDQPPSVGSAEYGCASLLIQFWLVDRTSALPLALETIRVLLPSAQWRCWRKPRTGYHPAARAAHLAAIRNVKAMAIAAYSGQGDVPH